MTRVSILLSPDGRIPLFSKRDWISALDAREYLASYCYPAEDRAERHMNAQVMLKFLYQVGAVLINSGRAYSSAVLQAGDSEIFSITETETETETETNHYVAVEEAQTGVLDITLAPTTTTITTLSSDSALLDFYKRLPLVIGFRGYSWGHFHLLFIMFVALDHLSPIFILNAAKKLSQDAMSMSIGGVNNRVLFPNKAHLYSDIAASSLLLIYIQNKLAYFKSSPGLENDSFLSSLEKDKLLPCGEDFLSKIVLDNISEIIFKPFQVIRQDLNWRSMLPLLKLPSEITEDFDKRADESSNKSSCWGLFLEIMCHKNTRNWGISFLFFSIAAGGIISTCGLPSALIAGTSLAYKGIFGLGLTGLTLFGGHIAAKCLSPSVDFKREHAIRHTP